jgi:hypothetical protein
LATHHRCTCYLIKIKYHTFAFQKKSDIDNDVFHKRTEYQFEIIYILGKKIIRAWICAAHFQISKNYVFWFFVAHNTNHFSSTSFSFTCLKDISSTTSTFILRFISNLNIFLKFYNKGLTGTREPKKTSTKKHII